MRTLTDPQTKHWLIWRQPNIPIVLKADGLALGKGVLICNTLEEAKAGVKEIMLDKKFGAAGNTMVIEEFMTGREVSVLILCGWKDHQDYDKRAGSQACQRRRPGT